MAKSILIVEDDNNIADLLRLYLEKEGYQATIAADGTQGIDLYRKLRPDLVLLDVMMPGVDGWGVLRAIRQDSQTPQTVFRLHWSLTPSSFSRRRLTWTSTVRLSPK